MLKQDASIAEVPEVLFKRVNNRLFYSIIRTNVRVRLKRKEITNTPVPERVRVISFLVWNK